MRFIVWIACFLTIAFVYTNPSGAQEQRRVFAMSWSPDGNEIATANSDGTITIWDRDTGEIRRTIYAHDTEFYALAWSPDGQYIASGGSDTERILKIWDAETGEQAHSYEMINPVPRLFFGIAWSPDSTQLALGNDFGSVYIYDPFSENPRPRLIYGLRFLATAVDWSPDGRYIALGGEDYGGVRVWDVEADDIIAELLTPETGSIDAVAWHPASTLLAADNGDGRVAIWNPTTGELVRILWLTISYPDWVDSVSWSRDGQYLVARSFSGQIRIWDSDYRLVDAITMVNSGQAAVAFSPVRDEIAYFDDTLVIYPVVPSTSNYRLLFASENIGNNPTTVEMTDPLGNDRLTLPFNDGINVSLGCSRNGRYLLFLGGDGLYLVDYQLENPTYVTTSIAPYHGLSVSDDGLWVAFVGVLGRNWDIYVRNTVTGEVRRLTDHSATDSSPALSPDGSRVVFTSTRDFEVRSQRELYIINIDGSNLTRLTFNNNYHVTPSWTPDGRRILFAYAEGEDSNLYIMDADGPNVEQLTHFTGTGLWAPAMSPDGEHITFTANIDNDEVFEIYVMNADGSHIIRVTDDLHYNDEPCWLLLNSE